MFAGWACGPSPDGADAGGDDTPADGETDRLESDQPEEGPDGGRPPLTADELAGLTAALERFAWWVPRLTISPIEVAGSRLDAQLGPTCPTMYAIEDGTPFWSDDCTTLGGTHFLGRFLRQRDGDIADEVVQEVAGVLETWGSSVIGDYVPGSAAAARPAGARFDSVCQVEMRDGHFVALDGIYVDLDLSVAGAGAGSRASGTHRFFGGPARDSRASSAEVNWVRLGLVPELGITEVVGPTQGHLMRWVDGAIGGLDGSFGTVIASDLALGGADVAAFAGCAGEPSGALSGRRADGVWVDVVFDAPAPSAEPAASLDADACDGCATAYVLGAEVGRVCPDLSELWSLRPQE